MYDATVVDIGAACPDGVRGNLTRRGFGRQQATGQYRRGSGRPDPRRFSRNASGFPKPSVPRQVSSHPQLIPLHVS